MRECMGGGERHKKERSPPSPSCQCGDVEARSLGGKEGDGAASGPVTRWRLYERAFILLAHQNYKSLTKVKPNCFFEERPCQGKHRPHVKRRGGEAAGPAQKEEKKAEL